MSNPKPKPSAMVRRYKPTTPFARALCRAVEAAKHTSSRALATILTEGGERVTPRVVQYWLHGKHRPHPRHVALLVIVFPELAKVAAKTARKPRRKRKRAA